ncbi:AAA family ATPase [Tropicibacter naphthalenivorans]|uniref:Nuclease SbcCD subunit C n=1 Tax=Tropicibacter naphthalenivorans TaxID=441103 RepID=A0A0P1GGY4_9RHOB|nr:AAA family ATPase [Tropicibacter naphthalenivorans]CUH80914.1 Nuclease SbcCD subunit C [Tropicibacter naphthalenivorans]SMC91077.1 exonuclease SbcC [Tropicibacter naphthalenivorans]
MQILQIKGENLASLSDAFVLDLTAEPLHSAGLFAITGETGAGKSTILDAMCLALYGNCPRLSSAGVNDDVPDASGETIKSSDARAILRRGAAQGWAEVTFVAPDAETYCATWAARRARGKADGRLQSIDRSLTRVADGTVLESQIKAVNDRVTALTGLTYDEFRRTVLLAQGDFDAFLRAGTTERAALLEKVTGTEVYRLISRRVYALHQKALAAVTTLEAQCGTVPILTDEARETLVQDAAALAPQIAQSRAQRAESAAKLQSHVDLENARTALAQASEAAQHAAEALEQAAPERAQLAQLETALSLRSEFDRFAATQRTLKEATEAETQAQADHLRLSAEVETAQTRASDAVAAWEETERVFKAFGPIWTQATQLDQAILTAQQEVQDARAAQLEAEEAAAQVQQSVSDLNGQKETAETALAAAGAALARVPDAARWVDRWPDVQRQLASCADLALAEQTAVGQAAEARHQITQAQTALAQLDAQTPQDRAKLSGLEQAITDAQAALNTDRSPQTRLEAVLAKLSAVQEMRRAARDYDSAKAQHAKAAGRLAAQTEAEANADAEARAHQAAADAAAQRVAALEAPAQRAEAAVSELAQQLRAHLEPDCPCPVCGATEHPSLADDALAAFAQDMRTALDTARTERDTALRAQDTAARAGDAARLAMTQAQETCATAQAAMQAATDSYTQARGAEASLPAAPDWAILPLTQAAETLEAERLQLADQLAQREAQRSQLDRNQTAAQAIRQRLEQRRAAREAQAEALAELRTTLGVAEQSARHAAQQRAAAETDLTPIFAAMQLQPDGFGTEAQARLSDRIEQVSARLKAQQEAEIALKNLAPQLSAAQAQARSAAENATRLGQVADTRAAKLAQQQTERAALLDGEPTDTHRTRHNTARTQAQTAKDSSADALAQARSALSAAKAHLTACQRAATQASKDRQAAQADLTTKATAADLSLDTLAQLIADSGQLDALRAKLKALEDAHLRAVSSHEARQKDVAALEAKGLPEEDAATLKSQLEQADAQLSDLDAQRGALQERLTQDDALRAQLRGIEAQIKEARAHEQVWAAVNDAIGSRQGDKFARVAQSVTLAMLVERANLHLESLKPRYRLAQGGADLSLHIVDRDMGDEQRSTRSLSGGERFLVSLSLALALSQMGSRGGLADTLFIDEGFGALDAESLDVAMDALEALQAQGRTIGVISHVEAMKDRIPVQVRVTQRGAGASNVSVAVL